ncbi:PTS sugar transporter subunit IIA [Photobacterium kishitanii]|uniref:PTS sugar transporter subunit IIA n=1 Tax=Photobacterium kishitanii TaxID=318456 RepID=UPI0007F8F44B|nr:PTS sugar transporter subunit IIA [Photobacterium kishitanii]OBU29718.1 PTS ascorbate-specific transporter subunit IIA [Photobacterium kishitanii]PSW46957.1 PTS ascorbate-specific transporter subunit IIA [Photobacterium kishitanii]
MAFKQSLIENNSIQLQASADSWEQAIKIGTDMLITSGAINSSYHDAIISSIKQLGPYIVIAPQFALPHARPENGVNKTAFALVTLQKPVFFEGEDEAVDVLITLAGSTSDEHMEGLLEVTQILDDEDSETGVDLDKLRHCRTVEEIYTVIDNALNVEIA